MGSARKLTTVHRGVADVFVVRPVADVVELYGDLVGRCAWSRRACDQLAILAERLVR